MSKQNVKQLEEILPGLDVTILGKYFVVDDGQFRWTGEVSDVTDRVLRKVKKVESGRVTVEKIGADGTVVSRRESTVDDDCRYNGYDELCNLVEPVEDEDVLQTAQTLFEKQGGYGPVSAI